MDEDKQTAARPVREEDLEIWQAYADACAPHLKAGAINWPMMVRSLIAEIVRIRSIEEAFQLAIANALKGLKDG